LVVAANSHFTRASLCALAGLSEEDVVVVHNGVAVPETVSRPHPDPRAPLRVLTVARLVPWKRVELAVEALSRLSADRAQLRIAGDGPTRVALERLARRNRVLDRVAFLGWHDDVGQLLEETDVLVHPSRHEWFGVAVLEALVRGVVPIVMDDAGGLLEVIPPDGLVVNDAAGIADALEALDRSPAIGEDARLARRLWASRHFSIGSTADLYAELYSKAVLRQRDSEPIPMVVG
jgi:glycosyltransferase involved in cell wall biosynthesis